MRCFYRLLLAALAFLFALMLASYCSIAQAKPPCYPGIAPTPEFPHVPSPRDIPYLTFKSWGVGSYWYCMDPVTGKWGSWYSILVYADLVAVLKPGETVDGVARETEDKFNASKTPAEKRALIEAAIERFRPPWQSCTKAIEQNIQPQAGYCAEIRDIACGRDTPPGERCRAMPPDQPPPPPPPSGTWTVAPTTICAAADKDASGKCVRRQTYVWSNGARGATAQERVDIGAACDPAVGAAGFYGVLGRPDRVAPCVKR